MKAKLFTKLFQMAILECGVKSLQVRCCNRTNGDKSDRSEEWGLKGHKERFISCLPSILQTLAIAVLSVCESWIVSFRNLQ